MPSAAGRELGDSRPHGHACRIHRLADGTVRGVWWLSCRVRKLACVSVAVLGTVLPTGCGSGDSTVAKTPQASSARAAAPAKPAAPLPPGPPQPAAAPPSSAAPAPDPCAVDLAAPVIARAVSELPRDSRSEQPWNPEPLAGNFNECAQLSAVIIKANTNAEDPNTRAVMFHLGKYIPEGAPDTVGFNGVDTSQCTGDTVALTYSTGVGLTSVVKFRWNGNGVELISNSDG